jgi:hypothetical protein
MPAGVAGRRFPRPWSVEETDACFIVRDSNGQHSLMPISRMSREGARRPICSHAMRPGALPST